MADKTVVIQLGAYDGISGLVLGLLTRGGTTFVNGSGDTLTSASYGKFSTTVTEALYGWYEVRVLSGTEVVGEGFVKLRDEAGTYFVVDSIPAEMYSPVVRSVDDTSVIPFFLDTPSLSLSGTKQINGGSSAAIEGAITYKYRRGDKYEYWLAYDADDRPTGEGFVQYAITDGTTTWQLSLSVTASLANLALIGTGNAQIVATTTDDGVISQIVIGDDYLAANGRQIGPFTVAEPTGFVAATSTCWFGGKSLQGDGGTWLVQGSITDAGATWTLNFDLPKTSTSGLTAGLYAWSIEVKNASGTEHTVVMSSDDDDREPTRLVEKYT